MAINNVISKLRANANMSQEQFASFFGVSRQSVQKWESGLDYRITKWCIGVYTIFKRNIIL